jgi:hypothetical protein
LNLVQACLWDSSIDPVFLNSNPIEICINRPPASVMQRYEQQVYQASESIRTAIRSLDESTSINFNIQSGFCEELDASEMRPRMRIELNDSPSAPGQAFPDNGFGTAHRNLMIPFLDENLQARSLPNTTFITQHEILHLLGIQHDDRSLEGANVEKRREHSPQLLELTEETTVNSIMNIGGQELTPLIRGENFRNSMSATPHDIECIRTVYRTNVQRRRNEQRAQSGYFEADSGQGVR